MAKTKNPAGGAPASLPAHIGDELAKLRARASLLETMLVEINGETLGRVHDALNQQAADVSGGLDALIRRLDDGEAQQPSAPPAEAVEQEEEATRAFDRYEDLESDISDLRDMSDLANSFIEESLGGSLTRVEIGDQQMRAITQREADIILFSVYRIEAMTKELKAKFLSIAERKSS